MPSDAAAIDTPTELDPRRWLALVVIAVAQLMVVLDASIVNIALPSAQHALGISTSGRQWVVTAYTLTFGGFLLLGGRIADFVGRKRMFVIGLVGFAFSSALGGAAQNGPMLFASRALQGTFAALLAPAALSLITVTFTEAHERAKAFGVYGAISGGGAAIGLLAGGLLTQYASWRWCLLVNVPIAVVTAVAALGIVHESRATGSTRYDIPGALTVTAGLAALVYGFTAASQYGWGSPTTVGFLVGAGALLAGFLLVERRSSHPLLPARVVLHKDRGGSYLAAMLLSAGMFGMFLFLTFYFQNILHYSALKAGFAFLPFALGIISAASASSVITPRVGPKRIMMAGFTGGTLGMLWLTQIGVHTGYVAHVLPAELLMSIGLGFAFVPMGSTALSGVDPHDAGVASAVFNTSQQVGGSLGTALLNTVAASSATSFLAGKAVTPALQASAAVSGFTTGFGVAAAFLGLSVVVATVFISRHLALHDGEDAPSVAIA